MTRNINQPRKPHNTDTELCEADLDQVTGGASRVPGLGARLPAVQHASSLLGEEPIYYGYSWGVSQSGD